MLQLIVAATALLLAVLAAPAAQAQSVKGSGKFTIVFPFITRMLDVRFNVNAYTRSDGTPTGNIQVSQQVNDQPGSVKGTYSVESLSVSGNQATVWARSKTDGSLHEFIFVDNGDGSVAPDEFGTDFFLIFGHLVGPVPLTSGDITVSP
jgi:hypothetical protein